MIRLFQLGLIAFLANLIKEQVTQAPGGNLLGQLCLLAFLALALSWLFTSLLPKHALSSLSRWSSFIFSLIWGRKIFIGHFHHDEWAYFLGVNENLSSNVKMLFWPLNEHFQPVFKAAAQLIYNAFGQDYFWIAFCSYLFALLFIHALMFFLSRFELRKRAVIAVITSFLAWSVFRENLIWKAAGLPLLMTMTFFLFWLDRSWQLLHLPQTLNLKNLGRFIAWNTLMIGSSSLVTLGPVYLLSFFFAPAVRASALRKAILIKLIAISGILSGLYFYLRNVYFKIPSIHIVSTSDRDFMKMLGSFLQSHIFKLEDSGHFLSVGWLCFSALLIASFFAYRKLRYEDKALLIPLGLSILFISILQIEMGRGLVLATIEGNRYWLFPCLGTALIFLFLVSFCFSRRNFILWLLFFASIGFTFRRIYDENKSFPHAALTAMLETRKAFFNKLESALCAVNARYTSARLPEHTLTYLPDFALTHNKVSERLEISPPFDLEWAGYTLEYYARSLASLCLDTRLLRFKPVSAMTAEDTAKVFSIPEVREFYRDNFGYEPAAAAR